MININTNRWESVRLLFNKHIIGVNLKSNYRWQHSVSDEKEAKPLRRMRVLQSTGHIERKMS